MGKDDRELLKAKLPMPYEQLVRVLLRDGYWQGEVSRSHRDGTRIDVLTKWSLLRDSAGMPAARLVTNTDLTDIKFALKAAQRNEAILRSVMDATTDYVFLKDRNGRYLMLNRAAAGAVGMTPEEAAGKDDFDLFPREIAERLQQEDREAVAADGSLTFELETPTASGLRCLHTVKSACRDAHGNIIGVVGIGRDITDRKATEEALRVSESRFRKLFESDLLGICIPDRFGAFFEGNDEFLRIVGYTRAELEAGQVRWDRMTPPEYQKLDAFHIAEAAERGSCTPYEKEYIRKDGSRVPIACGYALLEGSQDVYVAFIQDLTQQKRTEAALREREERFRVLAESLPEFVWIRDGDGRYIYCNQRLLDYVGKPPEWLQSHAFEAVHPDDVGATIENWKHSIETGEPYTNSYRLRRHDGAYRYFLARAVPMRDEAGRVTRWLGSTTDIHDQKVAEEGLRRTEKLSAAARLAASMSHEINNPLNSVVNFLYLALLDPTLNGDTRNYLTLADQELSRAVQVATQMLRFHNQSTAPALVDLSATMDSVLNFFKSRLESRSIVVEREYRTREKLRCFNEELRQVFANLISNSLDALQYLRQAADPRRERTLMARSLPGGHPRYGCRYRRRDSARVSEESLRAVCVHQGKHGDGPWFMGDRRHYQEAQWQDFSSQHHRSSTPWNSVFAVLASANDEQVTSGIRTSRTGSLVAVSSAGVRGGRSALRSAARRSRPVL